MSKVRKYEKFDKPGDFENSDLNDDLLEVEKKINALRKDIRDLGFSKTVIQATRVRAEKDSNFSSYKSFVVYVYGDDRIMYSGFSRKECEDLFVVERKFSKICAKFPVLTEKRRVLSDSVMALGSKKRIYDCNLARAESKKYMVGGTFVVKDGADSYSVKVLEFGLVGSEIVMLVKSNRGEMLVHHDDLHPAGRRKTMLEDNMQKLIGLRGTASEISAELSKICDIDVAISPDEQDEPEEGEDPVGDICFCFNVGMDADEYLDFDLFALETRQDGIYLVTEINGIN